MIGQPSRESVGSFGLVARITTEAPRNLTRSLRSSRASVVLPWPVGPTIERCSAWPLRFSGQAARNDGANSDHGTNGTSAALTLPLRRTRAPHQSRVARRPPAPRAGVGSPALGDGRPRPALPA